MCLQTSNELNPIGVENGCRICAVFNNPQLLDQYLDTYGQSFLINCLLRSCDEGKIEFISILINKPQDYVKDCIIYAIDYCDNNIDSDTSNYINMWLFLLKNSPKSLIEEYFVELCNNRADRAVINILLNTYGMPTDVLNNLKDTEDHYVNNIQVNCTCGVDHNKLTKDVLIFNKMIEECPDINKYDLSSMEPRLKRFIEDKCIMVNMKLNAEKTGI